MRIGKKTSKEVAFKPDLTEGVTRLICTCKGVISHTPSGPFSDAHNDIPRGEIHSSPPNAPTLSQFSSSVAHAVTGDANIVLPPTVSSSKHSSLRDDLACGLVSSEKNTSSSSDHVFIRSKLTEYKQST